MSDQPQPFWKMIERRHEGTGWQVFYEVPNSTGSARRRADAVAVGLWPSTKHEIHGYEFKESRSDTRRELEDISKHDAVGRYCDFWWLVVRNEQMIDGLLIPSQWGILIPRGGVLRIHRKAAKRKAKPLDRPFFAALARCVGDGWVPKRKYDEYVAAESERFHAERDRVRDEARKNYEKYSRDAATAIKEFKEATGIDLMANGWHGVGRIGEAVNAVLQLLDEQGRNNWRTNQLVQLVEFAGKVAELQANVERALVTLRQTAPVHRTNESAQPGEPSDPAFVRIEPIYITRYSCSNTDCGLTWQRKGRAVADRCPRCASPAIPADDSQGGPRDSGIAGAPEQDAGVQLRDQREALPDGEQAPAGPGLGV